MSQSLPCKVRIITLDEIPSAALVDILEPHRAQEAQPEVPLLWGSYTPPPPLLRKPPYLASFPLSWTSDTPPGCEPNGLHLPARTSHTSQSHLSKEAKSHLTCLSPQSLPPRPPLVHSIPWAALIPALHVTWCPPPQGHAYT